MDIKSPQERSENMRRIKGKNTKPEVYIRLMLYHEGFRYRKNYSGIYGHPDLYLKKYNTAIFVNGCFWHHHEGCKYATTPKTRIEAWAKKFADNKKRDQRVKDQLLKDGTKVLVIWECTVKKMHKDDAFKAQMLDAIIEFLESDTEIYMEL